MPVKYLGLIGLNIAVAVFHWAYSITPIAYYCGNTIDKPVLALDLTPSWFDGKFQFRKEYKEIIASTDSHEPFVDKWVRGSENFKTIIGYNSDISANVLYFKALNWEGEEQVFKLQEISSSVKGTHAYEVLVQGAVNVNSSWVSVEHHYCLKGKYQVVKHLFLLVLLISNLVVALKYFENQRPKAKPTV